MIREKLNKYATEVRSDVFENILPFWIKHTKDEENGGFWGTISNDLVIDKNSPKSSLIVSRILWTYAAALRFDHRPEYEEMAERAYRFLFDFCIDTSNGGVFWWLDAQNRPLNTDKKIYGQAYVIYALSEFYRVNPKQEILDQALHFYDLIEKHAKDPSEVGYFDFFKADWHPIGPHALGEGETPADKTMNTHLHILEAYTNLYRMCREPHIRKSLTEMVHVFLDKIFDARTGHLNLFFNNAWHSLADIESYGHDIEASWLLLEAAELLGDEVLIKRVTQVSLQLAEATLQDGIHEGAVVMEGKQGQFIDSDKHWWPQTEAMIGFLNAYQISGEERFLNASLNNWVFVKNVLVDHKNGEWFLRANSTGKVYCDEPKVMVWKGPYHNSRAGFEIIERVEKILA